MHRRVCELPGDFTMIKDSEISVVVQGPVFREGRTFAEGSTYRTLKSIRQLLPKSEIVLSTWQGSDTASLDFDVLLLNEDPGTIAVAQPGCSENNVNRQIVSTKRGVQAASRKYVLKLRTDAVLEHTGFLNYFDKFPERYKEWRILKERVLVSDFCTLNPRRGAWRYCFTVSDWAHFGLREDVLDIWDILLVPKQEDLGGSTEYAKSIILYNPEQYIWTTFLRKHKYFYFPNGYYLSEQAFRESEISIVNNLVVLETRRFGFTPLKYEHNKDNNFKMSTGHWLSTFSFNEWLVLYKEYCDPSFNIQPDPELIGKWEIMNRLIAR